MKTDRERRQAHIARVIAKAGGWPQGWPRSMHDDDHELVLEIPVGHSTRCAGGTLQRLQQLLEPKDIVVSAHADVTAVACVEVTWPWER